MKKQTLFVICALVASATLLVAGENGTAPTLVERISKTHLFPDPLLPVGSDDPAPAESEALWQAAQKVKEQGVEACVTALEDFLAAYPNSAWSPSLRANLAIYYRSTGRLTKPLEYWADAWQAVKDAQDQRGAQVARYVIVQYAQMLADLGRAERLRLLFQEAEARSMLDSRPLRQALSKARRTLQLMDEQPGIFARCGGRAMTCLLPRNSSLREHCCQLMAVPAPQTGHTLEMMRRMAQRVNLDLLPVRRPQGDTLVVPSIVHWRVGHYVAITQRKGNLYLLADPALGRRWIPAEVINEEASGYFMVASTNLPKDWVRIGQVESLAVSGSVDRFTPFLVAPPPCQEWTHELCCALSDPSQPAGVPGAGAWSTAQCGCSEATMDNPLALLVWNPADSCSCDYEPLRSRPTTIANYGASGRKGIPVWKVTEPYISLWLVDEPMTYRTSRSTEMPLRLYYHEHETRPITTNMFSFGPGWNANILSYIYSHDSAYTGNNEENQVVLYGPGGGERRYDLHAPSFPSMWGMDYWGRTTFVVRTNQESNDIYFDIVYRDGSVASYGLVQISSQIPSDLTALLTQRTDAHGLLIANYNYTNVNNKTLLTSIVDFDGRITQVRYYDTRFPSQVTEIEDSYGHKVTFRYNNLGLLTGLTNVAGDVSTFDYRETNNFPFYLLTHMTTSYGSTTFDYIGAELDLSEYGQEPVTNINRALTVTEATGAKHVYLFRANSEHFEPYCLPHSYPDAPCDIPLAIYSPGIHVMNTDMYEANSFYWGPRHFPLLSTSDVLSFTTNDYRMARMRKWLMSDPLANVTGVINLERAASPDGTTEGPKVWYGYNFYQAWGVGLSSRPNWIAYKLPNGETAYTYREYNNLDYVTLEATTYSGGGSVLSRANYYIYSTNMIDLLFITNAERAVIQYEYDDHHRVTRFQDALGNVTSFSHTNNQFLSVSNGTYTDPSLSLSISNTYDSNGWLTQSVHVPSGARNSITYSGGRVQTQTDPRGLTVTYLWDALGRLLKRTYPDGTTITNLYSRLDVVETKDRLDHRTFFGYDTPGRLTSVTNANCAVSSYSYCPCGSLESFTDATLTNTTRFDYDALSRPVRVTYPDSTWVSKTYDVLSRVSAVTNSNGYFTVCSYNNQGLLCATSNALGLVTTEYDISDRVAKMVDLNGVVVTNAYDAVGRLIKSSRSDDAVVEQYAYDASGLVTSIKEGASTYYTNWAGRRIAEMNSNAEVTQFAYTPAGDLAQLTDGNSNVTTWVYDAYGRVTEKWTYYDTMVFQYTYDAEGRLTRRGSPGKGYAYYTNDAVGNLTDIVYATSPPIQFSYDAMNRVTTMIDGLGQTHYSYDAVGQLLSEDGPWADDTVSYSYTSRLRTGLSLAQPGNAAWIQSYGYDGDRRLANITSPAGVFGYDYTPGKALLPSNIHLPGGLVIDQGYDTAARLTNTTLKTPNGTVLDGQSYTLWGGGRIYQVLRTGRNTRPFTNIVAYEYDNIGQLTWACACETDQVYNYNERHHEQFAYTYDAAGNVITKNAPNGWDPNFAPIPISFSINYWNQITSIQATNLYDYTNTIVSGAFGPDVRAVAVNGPAAELYQDGTFVATGLPWALGSNTYTAVAYGAYYDPNRMATSSVCWVADWDFSTPMSLWYDGNGNMTSKGAQSLAYDDENQLVSVSVPGSWKSDFTYDAKMRRRERWESVWNGSAWVTNLLVRYIYDGIVVLQERHYNPQLSTVEPQLLVTYSRGRDLSGTLEGAGGIGGLLARSESGPSSLNQFLGTELYHADNVGNISCLVATNGLILARYLYEPFGNIIAMSGLVADRNLCRFSSKEWHENSGLVYYGDRYYTPSLQRWLNPQPLDDFGSTAHRSLGLLRIPELNSYLFAANNPVINIDPLSLSKTIEAASPTLPKIIPAPPPVVGGPCTSLGGWLLGSWLGQKPCLGSIGRTAAARWCLPDKEIGVLANHTGDFCIYKCPGNGAVRVSSAGPNGCADTKYFPGPLPTDPLYPWPR